MAISKVPTSAKPKAKPRGASRKGRPNKVTKELKDMIRSALDAAGGEKYLLMQAHDNPTAFMTLIGKIIPKDINATVDGNLNITKIERVIIDSVEDVQ